MAARIRFNAEKEAESILTEVMCRSRWTVDLRDTLAARLEHVVLRELKGAGISAVIEVKEHSKA